jgi:long-subunit fatty acid transport protein
VKICIWAGVCLLGAGTAAWAQDQQLGARTKAMGGSYTAFEDDPVSVWLNPAGIATQPGQASISYQTYTAYPVRERADASGGTTFSVKPKTVTSDPVIVPSYIGLVFQVGDSESPMALGFCFAQPYLLRYAMDLITTPGQTSFQPQNELEESLSRFRFAFAKDFTLGPVGFLPHIAVALGADVGFARWQFRSPSGDRSQTSTSLGFGGGVLLGVYDNAENFKVNFGVAYQSSVQYDFDIDPKLLPAFDMPQQLNVGMTFYLFEGLPLRTTLDVQFIGWAETAERPLFAGFEKFENVTNYSLGFEYRVPVSEKLTLYPRLGYRRFDAPWASPDNLPATGRYKLVLDTNSEAFHLATFGLGISWTREGGRNSSVDVAGDVGGDAFNVAFGYTHEF